MAHDRKRVFGAAVLEAAQDQAALAREELRQVSPSSEANGTTSAPEEHGLNGRAERLVARKREIGIQTVECFGVQVAVPPGEQDAMISFTTRIPRRIRNAMAYRCQQLNMTLQDFVREAIEAMLEECQQLDER